MTNNNNLYSVADILFSYQLIRFNHCQVFLTHKCKKRAPFVLELFWYFWSIIPKSFPIIIFNVYIYTGVLILKYTNLTILLC